MTLSWDRAKQTKHTSALEAHIEDFIQVEEMQLPKLVEPCKKDPRVFPTGEMWRDTVRRQLRLQELRLAIANMSVSSPDTVSASNSVKGRLIHELEMWFCEGENCYERFATKRGIEDHMDTTHPGEDRPSPIDEIFRAFKVSDLEAERSQRLKHFHTTYPAVQGQQERCADIYAAYYSPTASTYFEQIRQISMPLDSSPHFIDAFGLYRNM